jgi:DNA invertase Pin-like site-specific DNA recombinase
MMGVFAEFERAMIRERVLAAREPRNRGSVSAAGGWRIAMPPGSLPLRRLWRRNVGCGGSRGT